MKKLLLAFLAVFFLFELNAQTKYKLPPKEVVDILDAAPTPLVSMSPRKDAMAIVDYQPHPSITLLSQPFLRIAGLRITPQISARQRITQYTGIRVKWIKSNKSVQISTTANARVGMPTWSYDGKQLAFTRDGEKGVELWIADPLLGNASSVKDLLVSDVLDAPFEWLGDNATLLVRSIPKGRGKPPEVPKAPAGPNVEETYGKVAKTATYQDLLKNAHDEDLFTYYATSQLALVDTKTGAVKPIGKPDLYSSSTYSPDKKYLLVTRVRKPYSYRVPYDDFARSIEVWDAMGNLVKTIAEFPVTDEIPTQGVVTGPRNVDWQPLFDARLTWIEALDGGDPMKKVPARDKLMMLDAPFKESPTEILQVQHRFSGMEWMAARNSVLLSETNRDRRWRTTSFYDLGNPSASRRVVFDLSVNDAYGDPGRPVIQVDPNGVRTVLQHGDWIYLSGRGASEKGDMPFLDKMNTTTLEKQRLFRSQENSYEQFVSFVGESSDKIVSRFEDKTNPPNYYVVDLSTRAKTALTDFKDPAPQMTGMRKQLIKYSRPDGVPLSGTLFLPPNYKEGMRLPLLIWAYPLEYSDASTAGQVRGSTNTFTFFRGASQLFYVTQGYAVLNDATMPVVGDPETMNNTFVEQIVSAAKAAIDRLDSMGVIDRNRVFVSGHSYGAFMTANLLAHCDLFAAGIARSGAYNRTLTPFGFQSERRSFWEAPEIYMKVSPFTCADKIKAPILLIHGEADNNTGTFPIQSERLFQAIKGLGGNARLVLLPYESHGYSARESVLHVLAESFEWADKYVKNRKVPISPQ
jgi:dipeptidyl aminopeptidase/acylaminoacyl peptidase